MNTLNDVYKKRESQALKILMVSWILYGAYLCLIMHKSDVKDFYFGTKSRYLNNSGANTLASVIDSHVPKHYKPIHINVLGRHGSRNPTSSYYPRFADLEKYLRQNDKSGKTLDEFVEFFDRLRNTVPSNLAVQGRFDWIDIGKRFCEHWDVLCNVEGKDLYVETTYKERTYESAFWYLYSVLGLYSRDDLGFESVINATAEQVESYIEKLKSEFDFQINSEDDPELRFFDACDKYVVSVDNNDSALWQVDEFEDSEVFLHALSLINDTFCSLGHLCSTPPKQLQTVYYACVHAVMMYNDHRPCQFVPFESVLVLEYLNDMETYLESYRGYDISYKPSCYLFSKIIHDIVAAVDHHIDMMSHPHSNSGLQPESETPNGTHYKHVVRVAHAETVLPVLALLDAVKTGDLTEDNFTPYRPFHAGLMTPMAANLVFVVYFDDQAQHHHFFSSSSHYSNYKVSILLNENVLILDKISNPLDPLAPVSLTKLLRFAPTCDLAQFEHMCAV